VLISTKLIAKIFVLGRVTMTERVEPSIASKFITVFIVMSIAMFITQAKENETIKLNESSPNCILTIRSLSIPSACVRCELFR
jgi:hypothetical protein